MHQCVSGAEMSKFKVGDLVVWADNPSGPVGQVISEEAGTVSVEFHGKWLVSVFESAFTKFGPPTSTEGGVKHDSSEFKVGDRVQWLHDTALTGVVRRVYDAVSVEVCWKSKICQVVRASCLVLAPAPATGKTGSVFTFESDAYRAANAARPATPPGGVKHDSGKPDFTMISYDLMEELAKVRAFGAAKYQRNQWKKGFLVTRSCAAALRHIFQFLAGETNDSESGLSHLAHAVASLEHALYDMRHHPNNDDRDVVSKAEDRK